MTGLPGLPAPGERLPAELELALEVARFEHARERTSAAMAAHLGVTAQQRMTLRFIGLRPGITPGRLASWLCLDAGTVSRSVAKLEEKRLVRRTEALADGRVVGLRLTAAGRRLDTPSPGTVEAALARVVAESTPEQLAAARHFLDACVRALDDERSALSPSASEATRRGARSGRPRGSRG